MNYKKTYVPAKGYTPICKIGECSLKKLEFGIIELDAGEKLPFYTEDREVAFIMLEGHCNVSFDGERHENIGNRANVFENRKAESFYMPREQHLEIEAIDHIKIAVCGTPVKEKTAPQVLREDHVVLKLLWTQPVLWLCLALGCLVSPGVSFGVAPEPVSGAAQYVADLVYRS